MKRILNIALSVLGVGGALYVLIKNNQRKTKTGTDTMDASSNEDATLLEKKKPMKKRLAVKTDGSLEMYYDQESNAKNKRASRETVHLKKDGSPDKRYRENKM